MIHSVGLFHLVGVSESWLIPFRKEFIFINILTTTTTAMHPRRTLPSTLVSEPLDGKPPNFANLVPVFVLHPRWVKPACVPPSVQNSSTTPAMRQCHYGAITDHNDMDQLSDKVRANPSLPYPCDLVNSLVKQVITIDETAAGAAANTAAKGRNDWRSWSCSKHCSKRKERLAELELKKKELETASAESLYHITGSLAIYFAFHVSYYLSGGARKMMLL